MKHFIQRAAATVLLALLLVVPALAQDSTLALTAFTDDTFGFSSVAPDGWTKLAPGVLARQASATDVTIIAQQATPFGKDTVMKSLLPQLALTAPPDSVGLYEGSALTWTLYKVDVQAGAVAISVDLAISESDGKTYVVLLQTTPDDYDMLHTGLFIPILDAMTPVSAVSEDVPYQQEEVTFSHDDITLAGTLTLPEGDGPFPAVVLVTGSGAQDRDESLAPAAEIKPFRLIADALTRAGMAVLRYDDRGTGKSTGDFATATTADFAIDASAAIDYLLTRAEINPEQIGLLGHSEGGLIAAMLGASNPHLAFSISIAGPAVNIVDVLIMQNKRIYRAEKASEADLQVQLELLSKLFDLIQANDAEGIRQVVYDATLAQVKALPKDQQMQIGDLEKFAAQKADEAVTTYNTDWWRAFLVYNPSDDWAKTTIPVLAIYGTLDVQVDADQNAPAFEAAMKQAGNTDYQVTILPDANHLMQSAVTGAPSEYGTLKQEFTPDFLPTILEWLQKHVDLKAS